jgi:hypothetical protein
MKRMKLLVKLPNDNAPKTVEEFDSFVAGMATMREFVSVLKREGFRGDMKIKPNKKLWFRKGEEIATLHLMFTLTETDVRRRVKEDMTLEELLLK